MNEPQALDEYAAQLARQKRDSLIAATQAVEAGAELLRFHAEGPRCNMPFADDDLVAKLAGACMLAARIEGDHAAEQPAYADYNSSLGQLAAACARFLSDQGSVPFFDVDALDDAPQDPSEIRDQELPF